jgi:hypothetical protein
MSDRPVIVFVEHVLWQPGTEWDAALDHVADRFARAAPLDVAAIRAAGALHEQLDALQSWADVAGADLDRELGRWFDEHLSMHVRPAPTVTRAVRSLAADGPVHLASALPARAAESIARHAGCWRSVAQLHAPLRSADSLAELVDSLDPNLVVAASPTPLPPDLTVDSLLQPAK